MDRHPYASDIVALGDRIAALSVGQAALLGEYLATTYGIHADAAPIVAPPPKRDEIVAPPAPTEFSVLLEGYDTPNKIGVIKAVREQVGLGIKEAKDFVEAVPKVVKDRLPLGDAEKLKAQLEGVGGKASIKPTVA